MADLSIIVASSGRPTLVNTVKSIIPQLRPGDELLVDLNNDCPWGGRARNRQILKAKGDAVLFMDDDDAYLPGALDAVRYAVGEAPDLLHLFCMRYASNGVVLGRERLLRCGFVSTQMVAAPRKQIIGTGNLGEPTLRAAFTDRYEGDFDFIDACRGLTRNLEWHDQVIAEIRPHEA